MQITHTQRCTRTITKTEGVGMGLFKCSPGWPFKWVPLLVVLLGCNSSGSLSAKLEHLAHNSKYIKTTHIRSEEQKLNTHGTRAWGTLGASA